MFNLKDVNIQIYEENNLYIIQNNVDKILVRTSEKFNMASKIKAQNR